MHVPTVPTANEMSGRFVLACASLTHPPPRMYAYAHFISALTNLLTAHRIASHCSLVDQEDTSGCFGPTGQIHIGGIKLEYDYDIEEENVNGRSIAGFSLGAKKKMYDTKSCAGCPYPEYSAFVDYYGNYEYADDWIRSALTGKATPFQGTGNADFTKFGFIGKAEAAKKGMTYMAVWMYVVRELRDAIDDCNVECDLECAADDPTCTQCNDEPVKAWDEGVAFYSGSLAQQADHGDGYLLLSLANKRGLNFGTHTDGMSWVNTEIFELFHKGAKHLADRDCRKAEKRADRIIALMQVPLIQGTLRYSHKLSEYGSVEQDDAEMIEKHNGEGATFAAAVLPMLNKCSSKDADTVYKHMKVGKLRSDYPAVQKAFENNYDCLGITCEDIGGVLNDESKYFLERAGPCGSGQAFKRYGASPKGAGGDKQFSVGASIGIAVGAFIGFVLVAVGVKKATGGRTGKEDIKEVHTEPVESYSAKDTGEMSII